MNRDLYTDEFRNFKYLKCPSAYIAYYKKSAQQINSVQIGTEASDPNFVWPCRLEFLEQLMDLRYDTAYFVEAGMIYNQRNNQAYDYEAARLYTLVNPLLFHGSVFESINESITKVATLEDIPIIEDRVTNKDWRIRSSSIEHLSILALNQNPLIPTNYVTYNAIFYDGEWAEKYRNALTHYLRKNIDAVSAITRMF
jgi:hypothetical protein